jgi:hypothetical protein
MINIPIKALSTCGGQSPSEGAGERCWFPLFTCGSEYDTLVKHRNRAMVLQGLMGQVVIVKMNIAFYTLPHLSRALVVIEIHFIILQAAPEALDNDIVYSSSFAIHANTNIFLFQEGLWI